MEKNEIPGMQEFGKKLAAEIDARKAAAEKKALVELKEPRAESDHHE